MPPVLLGVTLYREQKSANYSMGRQKTGRRSLEEQGSDRAWEVRGGLRRGRGGREKGGEEESYRSVTDPRKTGKGNGSIGQS